MDTRALKVRLHPEDLHNYDDIVAIASKATPPFLCRGCWYDDHVGCSTAKVCSRMIRHDKKDIKWVRIN